MIKILVADDHALIRFSILQLLNRQKDLEVVAEAKNGSEVLSLTRELEPDIVMMDLDMPGISGLDASWRILKSMPHIKIILLTIYKAETLASRALQMGIHGYVSKESDIREIIQAIRTVYCGQRYVSPVIAQKIALKQITPANTAFESLSKRELQIAMLLMRGIPVAKIAKNLHVCGKTVNGHRYRIFEKLSIENDVQLTLLGIQNGLLSINPTTIDKTPSFDSGSEYK